MELLERAAQLYDGLFSVLFVVTVVLLSRGFGFGVVGNYAG
jgi:hypothetical protein